MCVCKWEGSLASLLSLLSGDMSGLLNLVLTTLQKRLNIITEKGKYASLIPNLEASMIFFFLTLKLEIVKV